MTKVYRKLTNEQIGRGVIFSSELSETNSGKEDKGGTGKIHEIMNSDSNEDKRETERRLRDDKFFNDSPWKYNIIRQ